MFNTFHCRYGSVAIVTAAGALLRSLELKTSLLKSVPSILFPSPTAFHAFKTAWCYVEKRGRLDSEKPMSGGGQRQV